MWETLGLERTLQLDLGKTIPVAASDWRDTLRDSLPRLPVGDAIDAHFRIASVLGSGGMGVVHLAHQSSLGRDVAIKTVHDGVTSRDAENALLQEARVMGLVEHPNIVPVHVIGQDDSGRPIIVMKRIDGTSWSEYIDGNRAIEGDPLEFHVRIASAICNALSSAHARDILHRDIKPENVMVGRFGQIYLLDWGLAITMNPAVERIPYVLTASQVVGTPAFMAPEMTIGDPSALGFHTDIWLLGAVIYHFATGQPPNQGISVFDALRFAYEGDARSYPDTTPNELREIAERAMAHDPKDRYETADEVHAALEDFSRHRSSHRLAASAAESALEMTQAIQEGDDGSVHEHCGEARFGFRSALEVWSENETASDGLRNVLNAMFEYELTHHNTAAARVLFLEMKSPPADFETRLEALEKELADEQAMLGKIAFDSDDFVGSRQRIRMVFFILSGFFIAPFIDRAVPADASIPYWLLWTGSDKTTVIGNVMGLGFTPIFLVALFLTYRHLRDHMTSRVITISLVTMYVVGISARTSTVWADAPSHLAAGAEAAIYGSALLVLGTGTDRRMYAPGVVYTLSVPAVVLMPAHTIDIFSAVSVAACLLFFAADRKSLRDRS